MWVFSDVTATLAVAEIIGIPSFMKVGMVREEETLVCQVLCLSVLSSNRTVCFTEWQLLLVALYSPSATGVWEIVAS